MKLRARSIAIATAAAAALAVGAGGLLILPNAQAEPAAKTAAAPGLPSAATVFKYWNDAFLWRDKAAGDTYYSQSTIDVGHNRSKMWIGALNVAVAQDAYEYTRTPENLKLANDVIATYIEKEGKTWAHWDTWNDDIAWDLMATFRGYQTSGDQKYLDIAKEEFDYTWKRGWTTDGGGGIWEDNAKVPGGGKCALSNDPMSTVATWLYQATGDTTYLDKSKKIYDWVTKSIVDPSGQVNECLTWRNGSKTPTGVSKSDNAYNAGSYIEMADTLWRATGDTKYRDSAIRTADHIMKAQPIMSNGGGKDTQYAYRMVKSIAELCSDAGNCDRYNGWLLNNATTAWGNRHTKYNLTWNKWKAKTTTDSLNGFMTSSMVSLFFALEQKPEALNGSYGLKTAGNSTFSSSASTANWTLIPTSNGFQQIKNISTGKVLTVDGGSRKPNVAVTEHSASGYASGFDVWKPVRNSDGTYSFYNRNSNLALNSVNGRLTQATPNSGSDSQKFNLGKSSGSAPVTTTSPAKTTAPAPSTPATTTPATTATGVAGADAIRNTASSACVDVSKKSTLKGAAVQLWTCNSAKNQQWVADGAKLTVYGDKCLDVFDAKKTDGTPVVIWPCHGRSNQQWSVKGDGTIVSAASGKCLDGIAHGTANATKLVISTCDGSPSQKWARS